MANIGKDPVRIVHFVGNSESCRAGLRHTVALLETHNGLYSSVTYTDENNLHGSAECLFSCGQEGGGGARLDAAAAWAAAPGIPSTPPVKPVRDARTSQGRHGEGERTVLALHATLSALHCAPFPHPSFRSAHSPPLVLALRAAAQSHTPIPLSPSQAAPLV